MKFLLSAAIALFSGAAIADLYRWIDPETGSVKFSSYPPPWVGDPEQEKRAPKVEHIPERSAGAAPAEAAPATGNSLDALEERRKRIMQQLATLPSQPEFQRSGAGLKQQLDAYAAVTSQMDKLDPKGADRRRTEAQPLLEKLVEGLRTQLKPAPPSPR
jgi:uncharacterized protein DUF4124